MPLEPGTRLGPYEILAPLGAGGMGEVYRARDARLNRSVAVKVLPEVLAGDPDARSRFEREAQAVAALSHPNILAIHDFGVEGGRAYAATELLEGQTLRDRLRDGALPVRKAVEIAIGVARGIAAAHGRGIVHRDLKPENLFITHDGVVKILDFGLAKSSSPGPTSSAESSHAEETRLAAATTPGTVMGTVGYMAPEQVRGHEVDARADIFALGVVLYEMLEGRRPFERETAAETMTAILKEDPPEAEPGRGIGPALDRIVRHCLEKQPSERFQTARDVAFALESLSITSASSPGLAPAAPGRRLTPVRERLLWISVVLALAAATAWLAVGRGRESESAERVLRATIPLPDGTNFGNVSHSRRLAVSPDGARIAYVSGAQEAETKIYVHDLSTGSNIEVPDSTGGSAPSWSPDSRALAFLQNDRLMTADLRAGRASARIASPTPGAWGPDDQILQAEFTANAVRVLTRSGTGWREIPGVPTGTGTGPVNPVWLPDGRRFLVSVGRPDGESIELYLGDVDGTAWTRVGALALGRESVNVAYAADHLLHVRDEMIVARRFDHRTGTLADHAVVLGGPVSMSPRGAATFAVSDTTLIYRPAATEALTRLVWYDRSGARLSELPEDASHSNPMLSPDGTQLAVGILNAATRARDIWIVDLRRGVRTRVTSDPTADERSAAWFPDGTGLVFRGRNSDLFARSFGSGPDRPIVVDGLSKDPYGVSPDGRYLVYRRSGDGRLNDIWIKPMNPEADPRPLLASDFVETDPQISPDGRWLAYESNETGEPAVYITSFPAASSKVRVSPGVGSHPQWRGDGRELYFMTADRMLMSASLRLSEDKVEVDTVAPLFQTDAYRGFGPQFVVSRDGQRFLVNTEVPTTEAGRISVVFNWRALLDGR
jgi:serine/threonine protein kinase